jgi:hypothetical protein
VFAVKLVAEYDVVAADVGKGQPEEIQLTANGGVVPVMSKYTSPEPVLLQSPVTL